MATRTWIFRWRTACWTALVVSRLLTLAWRSASLGTRSRASQGRSGTEGTHGRAAQRLARPLTPLPVLHACRYKDPRIYAKQEFEGRSCDVFSAGVCLFVMVTGLAPWRRPELGDQRFARIYSGTMRGLLLEWASKEREALIRDQLRRVLLSRHLLDLLQRMLCPPEARLSVEQILAHPWLQEDGHGA
jgi:hypothetical protein